MRRFRDLLKDIRHEAAIDILKNTGIRIELIAWKLGYKETANVRKAFKARTGVSPREWGNKAINLGSII
jgi:AraC-like DNA-binding protein